MLDDQKPCAVALPLEQEEAVSATTLRRISWCLLPLIGIGYCVAILDRGNISFASLQMNLDLHFTATVYGFGAGLFSIGNALFEIPSNLALFRFGARRWIARIMLTWGLLAMSMVLVKTPAHLYLARFLLGMAEAGFFPGVAFYLTRWYPAAMRARAVSRFYIAGPLAAMANGLLAGPLLSLNGKLGLHGWQWLFLVEGCPAVLLSVVFFFSLTNDPHDANWLSTNQRQWLLKQLNQDAAVEIRRDDGWRALKDGRIWQLGLLAFCILTCAYAYILTAPAILQKATGFSVSRIGSLIAMNGLLSVSSLILNSIHSDRSRERYWHIAIPCLLMAVAFLVSGLTLNPMWIVPAFAVAIVSMYATQGIIYMIPASFLHGKSAAIGMAAVTTMGILGGFAGPAWMGWTKDFTGSYQLGLMTVAFRCLVAATTVLNLRRRALVGRKELVLKERFHA
jgi:MFS transporter, ACS family, tartrate transporter